MEVRWLQGAAVAREMAGSRPDPRAQVISDGTRLGLVASSLS